MKKIISLVCSLCLVWGMCVPVMASEKTCVNNTENRKTVIEDGTMIISAEKMYAPRASLQVSKRVLYLDGKAIEQSYFFDEVIAGIRWSGWIPLLYIEGAGTGEGAVWGIYGGTVYGNIN